MRELVTAVVGGDAAVRSHAAAIAHGFAGRTVDARCVAKRNATGQAMGNQDSPFDSGGIQPPPMLRAHSEGALASPVGSRADLLVFCWKPARAYDLACSRKKEHVGT